MGLVTGYLLAAYLLDRYGRRRRKVTSPFDAIVVAGCYVHPNGEPSLALARRTELAARLWYEGAAPWMVLTGGSVDGRESEARAAAGHARSLGVSDEAMILEERSRSTEENAAFTRELVDVERVLVVTDTFHVFRTERLFRQYFPRVSGVGSILTPKTRVKNALREVAVVGVHLALGKLSRKEAPARGA